MPLLRLRSDDQLVALFRDGHDEAFRVIHDRYRQRLFAYTRQMLHGSRQDAEDALQDVFVRAYAGLRANDRSLALRAWLYRVAHNRCIDELRRPAPPAPELIELVRSPVHDPIAEAEQRESLRRLIEDVRRLPEQQRSALLMRELSGMTYSELADAMVVSIPAVKSLLVRARVGLAQSMQARDTACSEIRDELTLAHDRGVRPNGTARRHLRDCASCREFRSQVRGVSRQFAALVPALGPAGLLANLLGAGGGTGAATGAVGGSSVVAAGGLLTGGAGHIATLLAAAAVTAGGAIEFQHTIATPQAQHRVHHAAIATGENEPTGLLAAGAYTVSAPALATDGPGPASPGAASSSAPQTGKPGSARTPPRGSARSSPSPSSGGAGIKSLRANPNDGSGFGAVKGVGPADTSGLAPPPASLPGTPGTAAGDSVAAGPAAPSTVVPTDPAAGSAGVPTTSGTGSGTSGPTSGSSGGSTGGPSTYGSEAATPTGVSGSGYPATVPPQ
jgi:RNA polymerase sigma factor (sigma-70 family)